MVEAGREGGRGVSMHICVLLLGRKEARDALLRKEEV